MVGILRPLQRSRLWNRRGLRTQGPIERQENPMFRVRKNFLSDESGVTAIEYALIASLIAVFIIAAVHVGRRAGQHGVQRDRHHAQVSKGAPAARFGGWRATIRIRGLQNAIERGQWQGAHPPGVLDMVRLAIALSCAHAAPAPQPRRRGAFAATRSIRRKCRFPAFRPAPSWPTSCTSPIPPRLWARP